MWSIQCLYYEYNNSCYVNYMEIFSFLISLWYCFLWRNVFQYIFSSLKQLFSERIVTKSSIICWWDDTKFDVESTESMSCNIDVFLHLTDNISDRYIFRAVYSRISQKTNKGFFQYRTGTKPHYYPYIISCGIVSICD